jgi:hypothetical protein
MVEFYPVFAKIFMADEKYMENYGDLGRIKKHAVWRTIGLMAPCILENTVSGNV